MIRLLDEQSERDLTRIERTAVRLHVVYCRACRRYKRQVALLADKVRDLSEHLESDVATEPATSLPAEARDRMKRAIAGD